MLSKVETEIGNKTSEELFEELGEAGAKLLIKTMEDIEKGMMYDWCLCNGDYSLAQYSKLLLPKFLANFTK